MAIVDVSLAGDLGFLAGDLGFNLIAPDKGLLQDDFPARGVIHFWILRVSGGR